MKKFDLLPDKDGLTIRVIASTKVGFVTAAFDGLFAVARPEYAETSEEKRVFADTSERPFSVQAGDFRELTVKLLKAAWAAAAGGKEAFTGIRFKLITDIKTEGDFMGLPVTGFGRKIKDVVCDSQVIQKNQVGNWEAQISFRV